MNGGLYAGLFDRGDVHPGLFPNDTLGSTVCRMGTITRRMVPKRHTLGLTVRENGTIEASRKWNRGRVFRSTLFHVPCSIPKMAEAPLATFCEIAGTPPTDCT